MEIKELHILYTQYPSISTDTRNIKENSIFFALKGDKFNGNEFAKVAIDKGAKYAIIDEPKYAIDSRFIVVSDVLKTLQALAHYHRSLFSIPIIGITGTNGKTTTKELTASILSKQYNVLFTSGNFNNHIGVPLTLLQMTKEHEIAVIEMGASHKGDIKELCEIADPNFGLITNIGKAHLEGFGNLENLIQTKTELYDYILTKPEGRVFLDAENQLLKEITELKELTTITYGTTNNPNYFITGTVLENTPYLKFEWCLGIQSCYTTSTKLVGRYNLINILAAISIGKYFGVNSSAICEAVEEYTPSNNRSQLKQTDKNMVIIDAYNANPTSMKAALENFKSMNVKNKIPILGDMKELGENTLIEHQAIIDYLKENEFTEAYLVGDVFSRTQSNYKSFANCNELKKYLNQHPVFNSYILLKGSRSIELEQSLDLL